jgi:hypothetical protein
MPEHHPNRGGTKADVEKLEEQIKSKKKERHRPRSSNSSRYMTSAFPSHVCAYSLHIKLQLVIPSLFFKHLSVYKSRPVVCASKKSTSSVLILDFPALLVGINANYRIPANL